MQIPIITGDGERIINVVAIYLPDEGGLIVEHTMSDNNGLTQNKTPLKIEPDTITQALSDYLRDILEDKYV